MKLPRVGSHCHCDLTEAATRGHRQKIYDVGSQFEPLPPMPDPRVSVDVYAPVEAMLHSVV